MMNNERGFLMMNELSLTPSEYQHELVEIQKNYPNFESKEKIYTLTAGLGEETGEVL
jgi:hypothetical protein